MSKSLKYSKQRDALITLLQSVKTHPSAEWLYMNLKNEFPSISLATVYRNLALLSKNGTILKLDVGSGVDHYDADTKNHYHFICRECMAISDIDIPYMNKVDLNAEDSLNAKVDNHSLVFYGTCGDCLLK